MSCKIFYYEHNWSRPRTSYPMKLQQTIRDQSLAVNIVPWFKSFFLVPVQYWSPWLTINARLINILVFLMFLLHSKYHSLLIIADVLLLAAVVPSVVVQLVCSIYISPVSFGIFGSSSCVGRFLSVHCDLVCVRVSFVDFNCYRFDSSFQILLGCCVMLQACLWVQVAGQAASVLCAELRTCRRK